MSYISTPLDYKMEYFTITGRLERLAVELGDKEVYVFITPDGKRQSITASELFTRAKAVAQFLLHLGVERGDVFVNCGPNTLECLIAMFGIICAGAIALNTSILRAKAEDVVDALQRTGAKGLILHPGEKNSDLKQCLNFIENVKVNGTVSSMAIPSLRFLLLTENVPGFDVLSIIDNSVDVSDIRLPQVDPEDYVILFATSGSTGAPKFVPHSHHSVMICCHQVQESMLFDRNDIIYCERRTAWIGGFPFMYLHSGVKTVTKTAPIAALKEHCHFTAKVLEEEICTIAALQPATILGLTDLWHETNSPNCMLKNIHVGSLPVADVCMDAISRYSRCVTNVYGSSEGAFFAANYVRDKSEYINYCAGRPLRGVEVKISDDKGMVVPRGVRGIIHVRSSSLFWQYYKDEERTREVLSVSHWMDTDDVGIIDKDGNLVVSGRKSDIILQGGTYFLPSQVEAFIKTHPEVFDVVVVSIPNDAKFALVCACVIGKPNRNLTAEKVKQFIDAEYLASSDEAYSSVSPAHILMYEDYPRLYTGKPDKHRLRDDAIERLKRKK